MTTKFATLDRSETERFSVLDHADHGAILWDHEEGTEVARFETREEALAEMAEVDNAAWVDEILAIQAEWAKPWPTDPR